MSPRAFLSIDPVNVIPFDSATALHRKVHDIYNFFNYSHAKGRLIFLSITKEMQKYKDDLGIRVMY